MITNDLAVSLQKFSCLQRNEIIELEKKIDENILRHLPSTGIVSFSIDDNFSDEIREFVLDMYRDGGWSACSSTKIPERHIREYTLKTNLREEYKKKFAK